MKSFIALALPVALFAGSAQAFEVTGGSVSLGYSSFTGDSSDANKTSLGGSLEFGLAQQFSVQTDVGVSKFGFTDFDNRSLGLHAIFHASDTTSVGGFIGSDRIEGEDLDFYGVEVGHMIGQFGGEAYLSRAEFGDASGTVLGLKGDYFISDLVTVGARYNNINVEGIDASRISLTGEFNATPGLAITGEIGSADIEDLGSETFVGIGVRVNFGAKRGATFDQRSVVDLLPGL